MDDDVSRYSVSFCDIDDDPYMERCEDGYWVYFEDYAALAAERDALKAALEAVADTTDGQPGALVQECRQIARTTLRAIAEGKEMGEG